MNFLGIGAMEFFVILIAALLIFGPGRLPELMGDAGRMLRDFRRATRDLTGDFEESYRDVRQTYEEIETDMKRTARELREESEQIARSVEDVTNEAIPAEVSKGNRRRASSARRPSTSRTKLDQTDAVELDTVPVEDDTLQAEQPAPLPKEKAAESARSTTARKQQPTRKAAASPRKPKPAPAAVDDLLAVDPSDEGDLLAEDLLAVEPEAKSEGNDPTNRQSED